MKLRILILLAAVFLLAQQPAPAYASEDSNPQKSTQTINAIKYEQGFSYLDDRTEEGKNTLKLLKEKLSGHYDAYILFVFDDFIFIKLQHKMPPGIMVSGPWGSSFVAIKRGSNEVTQLPDEALFVRAMQQIRSKPDDFDPEQRIQLAIILATGTDRYLSSPDNVSPAPVWTDSDGVLKIYFHRFASLGNQFPNRQECTLSAASDNKPQLSCQYTARQF